MQLRVLTEVGKTSVSQHHKGRTYICSQEGAPGTYKSPLEIEQITGLQ